jgi:hypothetical protein
MVAAALSNPLAVQQVGHRPASIFAVRLGGMIGYLVDPRGYAFDELVLRPGSYENRRHQL